MVRCQDAPTGRPRQGNGEAIRERDPPQGGFEGPSSLPEFQRDILSRLHANRHQVLYRFTRNFGDARPVEVIVNLAQVECVRKGSMIPIKTAETASAPASPRKYAIIAQASRT